MENNFAPDCLSPLIEKELGSINNPISPDPKFIFPLPSLDEEECFNTSFSYLEGFGQDEQKVEEEDSLPKSDQDVCFSEEEDKAALNLKPNLPSDDDPETKIVIRMASLAKGLPEPNISGISVVKPKPKAQPKLSEKKAKVGRPRGAKKPKKKIQVINSHNLKRHDVVLKSILRRMRRHLYQEFLLVTKFRKTEKQPKVRMTNLINCANSMVNQMEFPILPGNFSFYYLALSCPGELRKLLNDTEVDPVHKATINQASSIVSLIESVLNRFSKKIFTHFMEIPEISALVQYYLSSEDYMEDYEGFEPCINLLDEKSKEVISAYADNPEAFSLNPYWMKEPFHIFRS